MLDAGAKMTNPRTGTEFEIVSLEAENFVMRYTSPEPTEVPDFAEHYHVGWHEEFRILEGETEYRLGGVAHSAKAGDTVTLPEKVKHLHPRNVGPGRMVLEQHGTLTGRGPEDARTTLAFFFTMYKWEKEGRIKLDKLGLPSNPMQFALAGRILGGAGGYDARLPKGMADVGGATFGLLAEKLGYQVIDPDLLRP